MRNPRRNGGLLIQISYEKPVQIYINYERKNTQFTIRTSLNRKN